MASFLPDLWTSIFTAGPTPTLLLATNLTFASLQIVLLLLLLATKSLHFLALSLICAGLWWAINWFAAEVAAVKAAEEARKEESGDEEGERTEVEDEGRRGSLSLSGFEERRVGREEAVRRRNVGGGDGEEKKSKAQNTGGVDLSGEVSTDSEWEKVEDGR